MSTGQNYPKGTNTPNNFDSSVQSVTRITVKDLVTQFARLIEQNRYPEDFYQQITDSLRPDGVQRRSITYNSILDGLHLFRSIMHPIINTMGDYHAAALIRDGGIVELVLINWDEKGFGASISPQQLNSRYLMDRINSTGASSVLMISARSAVNIDFNQLDNRCIDAVSEDLNRAGIQLIDWVIMNADWNLSNKQERGYDYSQECISPDDVEIAGINN